MIHSGAFIWFRVSSSGFRVPSPNSHSVPSLAIESFTPSRLGSELLYTEKGRGSHEAKKGTEARRDDDARRDDRERGESQEATKVVAVPKDELPTAR